MKSDKRIVITGIGPICSLGLGADEVWAAYSKSMINLVKQSYHLNNDLWEEFYLHKIKEFDINQFDIDKQNLRFITELRNSNNDVDLYYFLSTIYLALKDSGLIYDTGYNDIGLILAHENPGLELFFENVVDMAYEISKKEKNLSKLELAKILYNGGCEDMGYNLQTFTYLFSVMKIFELHGYSLFINNACASGLFAIEAASRQIKSGMSKVVVVSAVDNPSKIYKYLWFKKKGLYSDDGITRPFSKISSGVVFGDGGASLVLEDMEHAIGRRAKIYGEYLGGGFTSEGWKVTVPNISDDYYTKSFQMAISNSAIDKTLIDTINPHGVGLKITDTYEANTINNIFPTSKPCVFSLKPAIGHNLGGSALLETAISLLCMKNNFIPATLNCDQLDENLNLRIVSRDTKMNIRCFAKMACGFAGFNGVVIFKKIQEHV